MSGRRTEGTVSGSSVGWITPQARDGDGRGIQALSERRAQGHGATLPEQMKEWPTPIQSDADSGPRMADGKRGPRLPEVVQGEWPTPSTREQGESLESWEARRQRELGKGYNGNGIGKRLDIEVLREWPSPAARDWRDDGEAPSAQRRKSPCLPAATVLAEWPTPSSTPYGSSNNGSPRDGRRERYATAGKPSLEGFALWTTPQAQDSKQTASRASIERDLLSSEVVRTAWPTPKWSDGRTKGTGGTADRGLDAMARQGLLFADYEEEELDYWPTPQAEGRSDPDPEKWDARQVEKAKQGINLQRSLDVEAIRAASWPTPTAGDAKASGSRNTMESGAHQGVSLTDAIRGDGGVGRLGRGSDSTTGSPRAWSTPNAEGGTGYLSGAERDTWRPTLEGQAAGIEPVLHSTARQKKPEGVRLHHKWVAVLMGFPEDWLDIDDSHSKL
jgi:hypothetical protein